MNPLLYGLYQLLKLLVRFALRVFYPYKIYIHGDRLRFDYPAIVVSNHPNTLMDPLNVAAKTSKLVFFLANAGLFNSPIGNWFFNAFYCIPVKRRQDKVATTPVNNEESFSRANDHLTGGGVLYIAPEGTSEMERRLRPLKTGTARIALSTEKKNNYQLGLAIIPVGLTYYQPENCGSRMVVQVGEPIFPNSYQSENELDAVHAVRTLTAELENQLSSLIINTKDEAEDHRLRMLESILQNDQPLSGAARFHREMTLLQEMRKTSSNQFLIQLDQYRNLLQKYRIRDRAVSSRGLPGFSLLSILALPVYLYGMINNLLPTRIPVLVSRQLKLYRGYNATVKILTAMITIPLFYWIQTVIVKEYVGDILQWLYLISLPVSGILAWRISKWWRLALVKWRYNRLAKEKKEELRNLRSQILGFYKTRPLE